MSEVTARAAGQAGQVDDEAGVEISIFVRTPGKERVDILAFGLSQSGLAGGDVELSRCSAMTGPDPAGHSRQRSIEVVEGFVQDDSGVGRAAEKCAGAQVEQEFVHSF